MSQDTDRALLEKAAKAAGYTGKWDEKWYRMSAGRTGWDPLVNDGDAFRLAMAMHMAVKVNGPNSFQDPNCTVVLFDAADCGHRLCQPHKRDAAAATRRAIVRAAASIADASIAAAEVTERGLTP